MRGKVTEVRFRGVLESRGKATIEAEVELDRQAVGRASAPVAIAPGRRENRRSFIERLGRLDDEPLFGRLRSELVGCAFERQREFDSALAGSEAAEELGADVRLVLSVAFCRATAGARQTPLVEVLAEQCGATPAVPRPLVNLFSGGIHDASGGMPFQQIMLIPDCDGLAANLDTARTIFDAVERRMDRTGQLRRYSASSGLLLASGSISSLFDVFRETLSELSIPASSVQLGIDVAAEHLRQENGDYRIGDRLLDGEAMLGWIRGLLQDHPIVLLEDPFDPADVTLWKSLLRQSPPGVCIVGDDLFATRTKFIDSSLASGILLKPNQVGSVSGALDAAGAARTRDMTLCVSHRSGETEDTFICDFAVAVGASYIKVGGPRGGDRTAKYNQLLRLAEAIPSPANGGALPA